MLMRLNDFFSSVRRTRYGLIARSRRVTLPGFKSQTVFDVVSFFVKEVQRHSIQVRATSMTYHFLMATFPSLLVLFTLIPYVPVRGFKEGLLKFVQELMPSTGYDFIHSTVNDIVTRHHGGLLSVGILLSLYYSSRGVVGILNAFDKVYPSFRRRKFVTKTLLSFKIMFLLMILVLASIGLIVFGQWLIPLTLHHFHIMRRWSFRLIVTVQWLALIMLFLLSFSLIYYYGPALKKRGTFFSPGSLLATVLSLMVSLLFSFLVNHFGQLNKLYGSIGTLIGMMLWIYWNAMILLVGFELNASIEINRQQQLTQSRVTVHEDDNDV